MQRREFKVLAGPAAPFLKSNLVVKTDRVLRIMFTS
jgi:hypothetical protein